MTFNFFVKVIDFIFNLIDTLKNDEYNLMDYETNILILCLVKKVCGSSITYDNILIWCWFQWFTYFLNFVFIHVFFVFLVTNGNKTSNGLRNVWNFDGIKPSLYEFTHSMHC